MTVIVGSLNSCRKLKPSPTRNDTCHKSKCIHVGKTNTQPAATTLARVPAPRAPIDKWWMHTRLTCFNRATNQELRHWPITSQQSRTRSLVLVLTRKASARIRRALRSPSPCVDLRKKSLRHQGYEVEDAYLRYRFYIFVNQITLLIILK